MSLFSRLAAAGRALFRSGIPWSDEAWDSFHRAGASTYAGVSVTPESALNVAAVYCAINRISTDVACLPLEVYRRRADGGRDRVRDTPHYELLNVSPDAERTAMRFRQALMSHVLGWGNGCAEVERTNGGQLFALHLTTAGTQAYREPGTKALRYRTPEGDELPPDRVLHVAGLGGDGINGYSPVRLAREAIGVARAAERFGASWFGNGTRTGGWIKLPAGMKPDAMENFRKSIEAVHRGAGSAHKIGFLEPGMEFTPTSIAPDDAQFLATRQFQILEIARMFGVPPHKLMDLSNAHLSNLEESNLEYLTLTLMPWCETIEQAMNLRLFTPAERKQGLFVEHNMAAFLRGNMMARAEFYTKLRDLGVVSPNEVRRLENMDPIGPEGDVRLVPLNMTSLANAGKPVPAPAAKSDTTRTA